MTDKEIRWSMGLRGLAAGVFGVLALSWPGMTLWALLVIFGVYALVDGVCAVAGSVAARRMLTDWWVMLLLGVFGIALGIITFARPGVTALILLFFIAARALVIGVMDIAAAIRLRKVIRHEWLLVLAGIFSTLFGVLVLAYPAAGALALVWLIGWYALLVGVSQIVFAIVARKQVGVEMPSHPAIVT